MGPLALLRRPWGCLVSVCVLHSERQCYAALEVDFVAVGVACGIALLRTPRSRRALVRALVSVRQCLVASEVDSVAVGVASDIASLRRLVLGDCLLGS